MHSTIPRGNSMFRRPKSHVVFLFLFVCCCPRTAATGTAEEILARAFDHYRGASSYSVVEMTIHRPQWERTLVIEAWSKGRTDSLFRVTAPARDRGNGTLKKGREMWMYNPKVNRSIKIPPSMMSQAWMGADFSNDDLAKSDTILEDYHHEVTGTETIDGYTVYVIRSIPKPEAPVVWGMQILKIRQDNVILQQSFYGEDLKLVKELTMSDIAMLGGRLFPRVWVMRQAEKENEYTRLVHREVRFDVEIPDSFFSVTNLADPRAG